MFFLIRRTCREEERFLLFFSPTSPVNNTITIRIIFIYKYKPLRIIKKLFVKEVIRGLVFPIAAVIPTLYRFDKFLYATAANCAQLMCTLLPLIIYIYI